MSGWLACSLMKEGAWVWRRSRQELVLGSVTLVLLYIAETVLGPGEPRTVVAALGWVGFALGAFFACVRALLRAGRHDRLPWILFAAGVVAWLTGQAARGALLIAGVSAASPNLADAGVLLAAVLFAGGFVASLRGQRLETYALILDASAVTLAMVGLLAYALEDVFVAHMRSEPLTTTVALLYTLLYAGATGAGFSVLFGAPLDQPRRAYVALFAGVGLTAVAYAVSLAQLADEVTGTSSLVDVLWMAAMFAISLAPQMWLEDGADHLVARYSRPFMQLARMALPGIVAVTTAVMIVKAQGHATEQLIDVAAALLTIVVATRAGLALYANWHLGELESSRARQFEALYEVGLAAAGERSLDELLRLVVEQATALSGYDGALLSLAAPATASSRCRASSSSIRGGIAGSRSRTSCHAVPSDRGGERRRQC